MERAADFLPREVVEEEIARLQEIDHEVMERAVADRDLCDWYTLRVHIQLVLDRLAAHRQALADEERARPRRPAAEPARRPGPARTDPAP